MVKKGKYLITGRKPCLSFSLVAANGEEIASSCNVYKTKDAVLKGIEDVRNIAVTAPVDDTTLRHSAKVPKPRYELYRRVQGMFYFDLCAQNGKTVLVSSGYVQKKSCIKGIESVRRNALTDKIVEEQ